MRYFTTFMLMLLAIVSASAYDFSAENEDGVTIYYNINGSTASVTFKDRNYNSYSGAIKIPGTVSHKGTTYSVSLIGKDAFRSCGGLTSVTIPESITIIDQSTFSGCSGLTSVTLPNTITAIGHYAFFNCSSLLSVSIPDSVTEIGSYAFSGCTALATVALGNSVASIDAYAFYGCIGLISMTIPNSITSIGQGVFMGCSNLTAFYGKYATNDNRCLIIDGTFNAFAPAGLTSYTIPNTVTKIYDNAFSECNNLTSVTIPESVTSIGFAAFSRCTNLISLPIPETVTTIGDFAFSECSKAAVDLSKNEATVYATIFHGGVKSVIIGEKITIKGSDTSSGINNLVWLANSTPKISANITYTASSLGYLNSRFKVDGFTYVPLSPSERTCMLIDCDYIANGEEPIILPEKVIYKGIEFTVTRLGDYLMARQEQIANVKFRDSDNTIPEGFFYGCTNLRGIEMPNTLTSISNYAFNSCSRLNEITIPESVTAIGKCAFQKCISLINVTLPSSLTSIGESAFNSCSGLASVDIGNSVVSIGDYAFARCRNLTSITIPNSVTSIGEAAFSDCTGIKFLRFDDSAKELSLDYWYYYSFEGCSIENLYVGRNLSSWKPLCNSPSLKKVEIGSLVTGIGESAFNGCCGLKEITIPNSVTIIGDYAFSNCSSLTEVVFEDGEESVSFNSSVFGEGIDNLRIGRNLSSSSTFANISTLKTVWITDIPTSIAPCTFQGCSYLELIYIGDNVTTIEERAFSGCSNLTLIQLGKNVTTLESDVLASCTGITNIYAEPLTPPAVATQALDDLDHWNCTLHVPTAAMDAYKSADQWKEFFFYDSDFAIVLSDEAISLEPGQTFQLTAYTGSEHTTRAVAAAGSDVRWVSTNPNVAVVDQNGFIVGTGSGKCSIAAFNSDNVMANCVINIDTEVERVITLDTYNLEIGINETHQFYANVDAATLTWSSSNPDVAEIDSYGFLTAKSPGTTLITATNGNGDSSSCFVTVRDKATAIENVSNDFIDISVEGSELVIEGLPDDALVHVFTLDGKLVYSGYERRIALQSGAVYIVVYPGGTLKIAL